MLVTENVTAPTAPAIVTVPMSRRTKTEKHAALKLIIGNEVFYDPKLKGIDQHIYLYLKSHMPGRKNSWALSITGIGKRLGYEWRTIDKALKRLEANGYIKIDRRNYPVRLRSGTKYLTKFTLLPVRSDEIAAERQERERAAVRIRERRQRSYERDPKEFERREFERYMGRVLREAEREVESGGGGGAKMHLALLFRPCKFPVKLWHLPCKFPVKLQKLDCKFPVV